MLDGRSPNSCLSGDGDGGGGGPPASKRNGALPPSRTPPLCLKCGKHESSARPQGSIQGVSAARDVPVARIGIHPLCPLAWTPCTPVDDFLPPLASLPPRGTPPCSLVLFVSTFF